jgi:hypothetical protein
LNAAAIKFAAFKLFVANIAAPAASAQAATITARRIAMWCFDILLFIIILLHSVISTVGNSDEGEGSPEFFFGLMACKQRYRLWSFSTDVE